MEYIEDIVAKALKAQGFKPRFDEEHDIVLEVDGLKFLVSFLEDPFFNGSDDILCTVEWFSKEFKNAQRPRLLAKVNELNVATDLVKVSLNDSGAGCFVCCAIQVYADLDPLLKRFPGYLELLKETAASAAKWQLS